MLEKPGSAALDARVIVRNAGLLQNEDGESGGVAVARGILRRTILALPIADQSRRSPVPPGFGHREQSPASVPPLPARKLFDDGFLPLRRDQLGNLRGGPQQRGAIHERLVRKFAVQIVAERLEIPLNGRVRAVAFRSYAHSDRRKGRARVGGD